MRPSILIFNPTAGRGGQRAMLDRLLPVLEDGGFAVEPRATAAPGDATDLARAAAGEGVEVVFVLGGDGTVREAAAGLVGGETPLAILPAGTTNVLAHALGLPPAPLAAARAHAGHPVRRLDVGLCEGQPFLMMASGGYDGFLLEQMDPTWKSRFGKLGIALQALFHVGRYRFPRLALRVDGEELEARFFAVCNIPFYAGSFELCPAAAFDDRRLDLVTFTGRGPVATAGFSLDVARGLHVDRADVVIRPAGRVEIHAPEALPLQLDGDAFGCTPPVVIELADETVPVLAPGVDRDVRSPSGDGGRARAALRFLMTHLQLGQDEMGRLFGVSGETIRRWERGKTSIPVARETEILRVEAGLKRLLEMFRLDRLPLVVRREAKLFGGETALEWILRGRIDEVADLYEATFRYQA